MDELSEATLNNIFTRTSYFAILLLTLESYHALSHICVLFRIRLLPKKDLVRVRVYFLVDLLTVSTSAIYTREVLWLAALQNLQHAFFFLTWNKNWYCIRVIDWSSLDWKIRPSEGKERGSVEKAKYEDRIDVSAGTAFDLIVHITYMYFIGRNLFGFEIMVSLAIMAIMAKLVLFNKRFSWSSPENVPKWVAKRVGHIETSEAKIK